MSLLIDSVMRKLIRGDLRHVRANYITIYLVIPTETACTECGHDPFTNSGYDLTCSTCNGLGYILSWDQHQVKARIERTEFLAIARGGSIPIMLSLGDAGLYLSEESKEMMERVMREERAYVFFGTERYRPTEILHDGVGQADEWRVALRRFSPEFRSAGY